MYVYIVYYTHVHVQCTCIPCQFWGIQPLTFLYQLTTSPSCSCPSQANRPHMDPDLIQEEMSMQDSVEDYSDTHSQCSTVSQEPEAIKGHIPSIVVSHSHRTGIKDVHRDKGTFVYCIRIVHCLLLSTLAQEITCVIMQTVACKLGFEGIHVQMYKPICTCVYIHVYMYIHNICCTCIYNIF